MNTRKSHEVAPAASTCFTALPNARRAAARCKHSLGPLVAALLAAALGMTEPAMAGATTSAYLENGLSGCQGVGGFAVPSGSPTSQASIIESSINGCSMRGSGFSYLGVVGASARAGLVGGYHASGGLFATASGTWADSMDVVWPERFKSQVNELGFLRLHYNVGATGGVSGEFQKNATGFGMANAIATIDYGFRFGGRIFEGSQHFDGINGGLTSRGTWGTIAGFIDLPVVGLDNGAYLFNDVSISLFGSASASVGNFFNGGHRNVSGAGEFGSTLIWGGVVGVEGFDAQGNSIKLPSGFQLDLIGRNDNGGLNYWNAAQRLPDGQDVPEPATWALIVIALAAMGRHRAWSSSPG